MYSFLENAVIMEIHYEFVYKREDIMLTDTTKSNNTSLFGFPYQNVEWTGGLYKERFDTCADAIVPHLQKMFESKEISHVLENFRIAAGDSEGEFDGTVFGDGDFYKWMEAAVYTAVRNGNQALLTRLEEYIDIIGRAQQEDGYISTKQIIGEKSGKASRLGDINDFEVYNFGHLFTSACLYYRLTGRDNFLCIARRAAGYLDQLYKDAQQKGEVQTAVCPSHYMGLAEMYRTTGEVKYLELLKKAIALRDSVKEGMDDNQDSIPLRKHKKIIGHAVRANYLYAGVADLCLEEEDKQLMEVLDCVWQSLVTQKMYITGGCGALYNGASPYGYFFKHQLVHQAYGYEYQLPNVTAYNETCASVGGVYWAWRMLCLKKKAEYADVMERMILNVNLAGVSMDGTKFFYENMLRRAHNLPYELIWGQERAEYILSYCCPPNLARLISQTSEYAYAVDESGIYTVLYGASKLKIPGTLLVLIQETEYPYDGHIRFLFEVVHNEPEDKPVGCYIPDKDCISLNLRIPSWVRTGSVVLRSRVDKKVCERIEIGRDRASSYLNICVREPEKMEVLLDLGMEVRLTCANSMVEEAVNQVAVECGPLVYCLEGMDAEVDTLDDLLIPSNVCFQTEMFDIGEREVLTLKGTLLRRRREKDTFDREALYQDYIYQGFEEISVRMIPYFAWDNRGMDEMRVWIPVTDICMGESVYEG